MDQGGEQPVEASPAAQLKTVIDDLGLLFAITIDLGIKAFLEKHQEPIDYGANLSTDEDSVP